MNQEIKRMLNSRAFVIVWFLFIGLIFLSFFLYIGRGKVTIREECYLTIRYENKEELMDIINDLEQRISNDNYYYENKKETDEKNLELYRYLYENDIEYDDFRVYNEVAIFENDQYCYSNVVTILISLVCLISIMFICLETFSKDFMYGTYKYLYTRNIKRITIIRNKMIVSLSITLFLTLISIILFLIIRSNYPQDYSYMIYLNNGVKCLNVKDILVFSPFIILIDSLIFYLIFTSICLFLNSYLPSLIISLVFIVVSSIAFFLM